jgi:hypothetical protein
MHTHVCVDVCALACVCVCVHVCVCNSYQWRQQQILMIFNYFGIVASFIYFMQLETYFRKLNTNSHMNR